MLGECCEDVYAITYFYGSFNAKFVHWREHREDDDNASPALGSSPILLVIVFIPLPSLLDFFSPEQMLNLEARRASPRLHVSPRPRHGRCPAEQAHPCMLFPQLHRSRLFDLQTQRVP